MPIIELHFPVQGASVPTDHAYPLYAALSRLLPCLHDEVRIRIAPISGNYIGQGLLSLEQGKSRLRVRLSTEDIPLVLPLAGKSLDLVGHHVRLGVPSVRALIPAPNLIARMVTIKRSNRADKTKTKDYMEPRAFLEAVHQELTRKGIAGEPAIPFIATGPRAGQPRRHVLRIKDKLVVGFSVLVQGLLAEESIRLQEEGLGGRSKMGCGFFVPFRGRG